MEPTMTSLISIGGPIAAGAGKIIAPNIASRLNKYFNPTNIDKAIRAGITAVGEWEEQLSPPELLFYSAKSDGWNSYHKYLKGLFQHRLVLAELEKPLADEGEPDVDILVEVFRKLAPGAKIKLVENSLRPWVEGFVAGYCREAGTYIQFQVAKENYCQLLAKSFDKVQFVGTAVPGQEVDKSDRLPEIFVMPDVEEISTGLRRFEAEFFPDSDRPRQAELMREQRQRSLLGNRPGNKFLAKQLLEGRHSSRKAVLLGAPGSGKTTLMSYFAVTIARQEPEALGLAGQGDGDGDTDLLPILIKIRDWERQSEDMNLLEYAGYFARKNLGGKSLPQGFFEHWLAEGRGLILLDGLDEVAKVGKRQDMVRRIESFLQQYEGNWAIVTSRPAGYRGDFFRTEEFPHYQLEPFDDEKIERFIENWYDSRVKDPEEAERRKESLRGALEESDRIKLLARNPLLLTIIALIHRYRALLPKERHKLYDNAVETLLTSWDAYKEISSHKVLNHVTLDDLRRLMEVLALWVHTQGSVGENEGGTLIDKDELILQLSREIKSLKAIELFEGKEEAKRFLGLMRDRAGLLNEQGQDCYAFVHKTFQEYLCAQEINYQADNEDDFEIVLNCIGEHLHDAHWREVLLLLVAQQKRKKAARAIRAILNAGSEYEEWLHRDLLFAGSCLAENPSYLQAADGELSGEILQKLVELEVSEGSGDRVRGAVWKILRSMKETEFQTQALELLKEREDIDEERLLEYRVALGEKEEVLRILVARLKDEDSDVRGSAASALGKLGKSSPSVVSPLVELLKDEKSSVRGSAASALGKLGNSSQTVVSALVELLKDEDSSVRWSAADALGKLGNSSPTAVSALVELLKDEDSYVRGMAADALGKLGKSSPTAVSALVELLKDEESYVRGSAADALGKLGKSSPIVVSALVELLSDEKSSVRWRAAIALSNLGNSFPSAVSALVELLKDEDSTVRWGAAYALGELGNSSPTLVSALVELLKDEDSLVRWRAADALGKLGNSSQTVVSVLMELLKDEDSDVRGSAPITLGNLGNTSPTIVSPLLELLSDEDSFVRGTVAIALGKLGKKSRDVVAALAQWIARHQDSRYLDDGINALWDAVVEEES